MDVVFDTAGDRYRVAGVAANANVTDPFSRSAGVTGQDWTTGLRVTYATDAELKGIDLNAVTTGTLRFSTMGHPTDTADADRATDYTVTLLYQGQTKTLTVTPYTGVATIQ